MFFEEELGQESAKNRLVTYEITDAQTCGNLFAFGFWPRPEAVGTVYRMEYDIATEGVKVTGID
jgi:hypothetical protein